MLFPLVSLPYVLEIYDMQIITTTTLFCLLSRL